MVKHFLPFGLLCGFALVAVVATQASGESPRSISFENGLNALVDDTKGNAGDSITFMKEGKETGCSQQGDPGVLVFRDVSEIHFKGKRHSYFVTEWAAGTHGFRISVLDPSLKENCELKSFDAPYFIKYEVVGRSLKITVAQGKEVTWSPH